jgi:hypothetical protein
MPPAKNRGRPGFGAFRSSKGRPEVSSGGYVLLLYEKVALDTYAGRVPCDSEIVPDSCQAKIPLTWHAIDISAAQAEDGRCQGTLPMILR